MLKDEELRSSLIAGARWSRERDLPDPVGWADVTFDPDLTVSVIRGRLADGLAPAVAHCMPLPKGVVGAALRQVTVCDPFDDVVFRTLVGKLSEKIDGALGDEVTSYRLVERGAGWTTRNYRYGDDDRRQDLVERLASPKFGGLGLMDVRQYYPSIGLGQLGEVLCNLGCREAEVRDVTEYIGAWQFAWGVTGVPIGPEGSALLGNAFLVPVDRILRNISVPFSRHTDDYRLWLPSSGWWQAARDAVTAGLTSLDLVPNPNKTKHYETPHGARLQLVHGDLDSLRALLKADVSVGLRLARELFDLECAKFQPERRRLAFLLGVLRVRLDPHGLSVAMENEALLRLDPRAWGLYFTRMHGHGRLDLDWAVEVALAPLTPATAAVSYRMFDALRKRRVGADIGRRLGEFARDGSSYVPVRCMAAEAWANSDGWKPGAAAAAGMEASDAQHRRALVLTLRHSSPGRVRDKALRRLGAIAPECRPAVRWIEERGDVAA